MLKPITALIGLSLVLAACSSTPKLQPDVWGAYKQVDKVDKMQVFYGEPTHLKYKKVCKISASGSNALESKYTKISDFETQFKRRARRCRGANAVIINNMFAFEHGSAFADGAAVALEQPGP